MTSPRDSDLCLHLLESLPTGIFAVDLQGKIAFCNTGAERITGYLKQEVMGRLCNDGFLEPPSPKTMFSLGTWCHCWQQ